MNTLDAATDNIIRVLNKLDGIQSEITEISSNVDFFANSFIPLIIAIVIVVVGCRIFYKTFLDH